jgi:hypothetical protein
VPKDERSCVGHIPFEQYPVAWPARISSSLPCAFRDYYQVTVAEYIMSTMYLSVSLPDNSPYCCRLHLHKITESLYQGHRYENRRSYVSGRFDVECASLQQWSNVDSNNVQSLRSHSSEGFAALISWDPYASGMSVRAPFLKLQDSLLGGRCSDGTFPRLH